MTVRSETFKAAGGSRCFDGQAAAEIDDQLFLREDEKVTGGYVLADNCGRAVAVISPRHWVSQELALGRILLYARVNGRGASTSVRVAIGEDGESFEMPPMLQRAYRVALSGVSFYQGAVKETLAGSPVQLLPESSNPHDARAIGVWNANGDKIGYLPRDGWLTGAILDEGKECQATVVELSASASDRDAIGVLLSVTLS